MLRRFLRPRVADDPTPAPDTPDSEVGVSQVGDPEVGDPEVRDPEVRDPEVRDPDDGGEEELALFHRCCREIHQSYLASQEGRLPRETYLERKLDLLRTAVRDAEDQDEGERLIGFMETLRLTCAVNDVEVESVRRHFGA